MTAEEKLEHGNLFPFDAPDSWWEAEAADPPPPPPPEDWAHAAARGVLTDLQDRGGIKHGLQRGNIDEWVRRDIVGSLAQIIRVAHTKLKASKKEQA